MTSYKEASCPECVPPAKVQCRVWKCSLGRSGAVSRALIKQQFHCRAWLSASPRSAARQPSCRLDDRSPYISVTKGRGPLPHKPEAGEQLRPSHFRVCAREDPRARVVPGTVVFFPWCLCKYRWAQLGHHLQLTWKKGQNRISGYAAGCGISLSP